MADRHPARRWWLEPPDRAREAFVSKKEAVAYLREALGDAGPRSIRRLGPGCYRYDPPIIRTAPQTLGPWLLYNGAGARYLQTIEQLELPFVRDRTLKLAKGITDGV